MNQKVTPRMAALIVVAVIGLVLVGMKLMGGLSGGDGGEAVVVNPKNPNDPKYTENLPKNLGGGGFNKPH